MCIIGICEKRALTKKEFDACWDNNSHGMGYAHWDGEKIISTKGHMKQKEAWDIYQTVALPHVVHFRIRSAGEVIPELTHPFLIEHASRLFGEYSGQTPVLFHNGTVSDWRELVIMAAMQTKVFPDGEMSDSRAMAIAMSIAGERILEFFQGMKWVVVEKNGFRKYGHWTEGEDGLLFSNGGFEKHKAITYSSIGDWPARRDYSGIPVQQTFITPAWTRANNYADRSCTNCVYYVTDEIDNEPFCLFKESKLVDVRACGDWEDSKKSTPERLRELQKTDKTCEDCGQYIGIRKGRPTCKHLGKMKNVNLCGRFTFKPTGNVTYLNGKNCKTCLSYEGGMTCVRRGVLKDLVACKEYEKQMVLTAPSGENSYRSLS